MTQKRKSPPMEIEPLSGAIGAEIRGVDLSEPLSDESVAAIRRAWLKYLVIFLRNQELAPENLVAFANHLGIPMEYPMVRSIPGHPFVIEVIKEKDETVNFGGLWHTDTAYLERPPMGTLLYALEVPPTGGDTLFANGYLAFEALSEAMQNMLRKLRAVHRSDGMVVSASRAPRQKEDGPPKEAFEAVHPVVRTHPETGRKALFVNGAHTCRFEGMSEEESRPLLEWLFGLQVRPEFTCRFRWKAGSLALWDNRVALHNPVNDYHGHRRRMQRVQIEGDRPV